MLVCIVRHGIAIDREDPDCPPDPERALTDKGIRRTQAAARGLTKIHDSPDVLLSSPYTRAMQTAEIFAAAYEIDKSRIQQTDTLLPGGSARALCRLIDADGAPSVMCVGHAPNLDELVSELLGTQRLITQLKKSGAAIVEWHGLARPNGYIQTILTPKALRGIANKM